MQITIDPRQPDVLIVRPSNRAAIGLLALALFGAISVAGGIDTLLTQSAVYRWYGVFMLITGGACLSIGVLLLLRRRRITFDRVAEMFVLEHKGLFRSRAVSRSLDTLTAVMLVRYTLLNRIARSEWYRLQIHDASGVLLELASKLPRDVATGHAEQLAAFLSLPIEQRESRVEGVIAGR